jgi:hypothetical protein
MFFIINRKVTGVLNWKNISKDKNRSSIDYKINKFVNNSNYNNNNTTSHTITKNIYSTNNNIYSDIKTHQNFNKIINKNKNLTIENKLNNFSKNTNERSRKNISLNIDSYLQKKTILDNNNYSSRNSNNNNFPSINSNISTSASNNNFNQNQSHNFITEITNINTYINNNDDISVISNLSKRKIKGGLDFGKNSFRKNIYLFNRNPSSYDYSPNYDFGNKNKICKKDEEYNKKKFKLMKVIRNYECRSEYQVIDF